jgi:hypothetical protein
MTGLRGFGMRNAEVRGAGEDYGDADEDRE